MNEHTPFFIIDIIIILAFIIWVLYNSFITNDPFLMGFFDFVERLISF